MATVTMTLEEYEALISMIRTEPGEVVLDKMQLQESKPKKRNTAYTRRYKKAFKKIAPKYKLKSGKWKKNGFKTAVKLAHKEARK